MEISVNPKIIKACKAAGIKAVKVRHGRNRGRWGWAVGVSSLSNGDIDTLECSGRTFATEELALAGAYYHYTKGK